MPQGVSRLKINRFRRIIVAYSKRELRRFPWRVRTTPYRVLVSELMLQRTGASQVRPVYEKFLENVSSLKMAANTKSQKLKRLLYPLGRTDRYRVLARAFRYLGKEHSCRVPSNMPELMRVPGIGPYTARSVLCFGYGKRVGLVDPGIYRVFRRVFGIKTTRNRFHTDPKLWQFADEVMPRKRVKEFNWALLDLAAVLCKKKDPYCSDCPLIGVCSFGRRHTRVATES